MAIARGECTTQARGTHAQSADRREEIARVAYELYERHGRRPGRELDDWLEAERIVRQQRVR